MLIEQTAVAASALPLEAFKAHLRLATGFANDDVPDAHAERALRAALAAIEGRTAKALLSRDVSLSLLRWRAAAAQPLPMAPVSAVTSVVLTDRDGVEVPVDPARWRLAADAHRPQLCATGALLPAVPPGGKVTIAFTAGFGAAWPDLPADLAQAVMLLAAAYFEHRVPGEAGDGAGMPFGVMALIERWRTVRTLAGGAG